MDFTLHETFWFQKKEDIFKMNLTSELFLYLTFYVTITKLSVENKTKYKNFNPEKSAVTKKYFHESHAKYKWRNNAVIVIYCKPL